MIAARALVATFLAYELLRILWHFKVRKLKIMG